MSNADSAEPEANQPTHDQVAHDASPGGPINAPGDEPDPESETEQGKDHAGRNDVVEDQPAPPHPPG